MLAQERSNKVEVSKCLLQTQAAEQTPCVATKLSLFVATKHFGMPARSGHRDWVHPNTQLVSSLD